MDLNKKAARIQISNLLDRRCGECEIRKDLMRIHGNNTGQNVVFRYCTKTCPVGVHLQLLGKFLLTESSHKPLRGEIEMLDKVEMQAKVEKTYGPDVTKDNYIIEKAAGKNNTQIERDWGLKPNAIYALLKKWDITGTSARGGLQAREI